MSHPPTFRHTASSDEFATGLAERCYDTAQRELAGPPYASEATKYEPDSPEAVRRHERTVRDLRNDPSPFSGPEHDFTSACDVTSAYDTSGDPQLAYDRVCHEAAHEYAAARGAALFGEEDQYRRMGAEGPAMRGLSIRKALQEATPFGILDPIDGTHQFAAMYQPGAFASAVLTFDSLTRPACAIALGTGAMVSTAGNEVWLHNLADPLSSGPQQIHGPSIAARSHYAKTWVLPAYKPDRMTDAAHIVKWAYDNLDTVAPPKLVAPLGGNPGIISSMVLAKGGAVAAFQPECWAWDHFSAYICAILGFSVLSAATGERYLPKDLIRIFLWNLGAGSKTEALVIGKTFLEAQALRKALIGAAVVS
jgi:hypothetical protein